MLFIRPRTVWVCFYVCMYVCMYVSVYVYYYIMWGGQGKGNETIRGFLSVLTIPLSKHYSTDTQHTACTNTQYHAIYLTGDPRSCSLRFHSAGRSSKRFSPSSSVSSSTSVASTDYPSTVANTNFPSSVSNTIFPFSVANTVYTSYRQASWQGWTKCRPHCCRRCKYILAAVPVAARPISRTPPAAAPTALPTVTPAIPVRTRLGWWKLQKLDTFQEDVGATCIVLYRLEGWK